MNPTTFPYRLHHMLQAVKQGDSPPVTWLPHGRAFIVTDQQRFLKDVIPVYFSQTKMRSFTRQLNLWGFKRLPSGSDRGAWYHEHFLRDEASKLELIKRTPIKGAIYTKSIERFNAFMKPPDFYAAAKLQQRPLQTGASDPASADGLSTSEMFMCDENGKEEPLELPTDGISNVPAPLQVPPRQVTMETEPEQLDLNMLSEQWQRFDIQLNAPNFSRYAPLVQNCNLQQQPLPFSDAAFQVLAQSLFPRPIRGTQTHAPLQHAACTADSFSQGVERRHGVPCLSSPVLEVGAEKTHSLGIDGHPRVERDNRDVSDAEFEAFLSDYF